MSRIRELTTTFALAVMLTAPVGGQQPRPMTVGDVLALRQITRAAISPNGAWIAAVIQRPGALGGFGFNRADVWLIPREGGAPRDLTRGVEDRSSSWNPVWSPDGKRLAFLSSKGGDNVRLYVWDSQSDSLRRLTAGGVDLAVGTDEQWPGQPIVWIDSFTVLCPVLPAGTRPELFFAPVAMQHRAASEWAKTERGEPAVSVLESGREIPTEERPQGQLLLIDARSGSSQVAAEGTFRLLLISPTRRAIALIGNVGRVPPDPARRIPIDGVRESSLLRTRLGLLPLSPVGRPVWVGSIYDPALTDGEGGPVPHRWSPDGSSLAVIGKQRRDEPYGATAYLVTAQGAEVRRLTDRRLEVSAAAWSTTGALLVAARQTSSAPPGPGTTRLDWWRLDLAADAGPRRITSTMPEAPAELFQSRDGNAMLGLASAALWSVDVGNGVAEKITPKTLPVRSLVRARGRDQGNGGRPGPVIETSDGRMYRIDLRGASPRVSPFPRPSASASVMDFDEDWDLAVFAAAERTGTYLWTRQGGDPPSRRITLNGHLRQIADVKRLLVDYRGADGDSLRALLVLPVGYRPGKRYPLVTWVYGGDIISDTSSAILVEKQTASAMNLHLFPSRGYALLIPSIPLSPRGVASDPMIEIPKGVLPAVDRAVELGIADPSKLGVIGVSYGGYSTFSLVTQTGRFAAAVALAGPADLPSQYGQIFAERRYQELAHELLYNQGGFETGQMRMGGTPWQDLWRYLRNSPFYLADRVTTPTMIIQGDLDFIALQQGEEFFTALYRMGKPAKFVRYWGEGHVIGDSEANVRDMWCRIFEWFDQHFAASRSSHDQPRRNDGAVMR